MIAKNLGHAAIRLDKNAFPIHVFEQGVTSGTVATTGTSVQYTFDFTIKDWVEHDPDMNSLRHHPRFQALLRKLR